MMSSHPYFHNPFFNRQRITDPAFFFGRASHIEALYSAAVTRQCRSLGDIAEQFARRGRPLDDL